MNERSETRTARLRMRWALRWLGAAGALGVLGWGVLNVWPAKSGPGDSTLSPVGAALPKDVRPVAALGRIEPKDGLIRVAGPSGPAVVISRLLVEEGDRVEVGQILAHLDTLETHKATVRRIEAELANVRAELRRNLELHTGKVISDSRRESWELKVAVAEAELSSARTALDLTRVRSPITGQVIEVHAREGERVGPKGIVELGNTAEMFAIAEVYETDVGRVRVGQRATITSPALSRPSKGTVERIGLKVGKLDAVGADPAAKTDARVVEVQIRLDEGQQVAGYTNLQVEVEIEP